MPVTLAGLSAREAFDSLRGAGMSKTEATAAMLRAWNRGRENLGTFALTASGNSDGAEHATYRITLS